MSTNKLMANVERLAVVVVFWFRYGYRRLTGRPYRILVVCTGNTCRSPRGETILRSELRKLRGALNRPLRFADVRSAGTGANYGSPMATNSRLALRPWATEMTSQHKSCALKGVDLDNVDHVICMDRGHLYYLRTETEYPGPATVWNIADPFGGNQQEYQRACDQIVVKVQTFIEAMGG